MSDSPTPDIDPVAARIRAAIESLEVALVVGYGVTGRAVAQALLRRGVRVLVVDDRADAVAENAAADGLEVSAATGDQLRELVETADLVIPSPGVPQHHGVYLAADAADVPVVSELDLAAVWDARPIAAITGTNGKTTVTTLVTTMLGRAGIRAVATGNTDIPLVEAVDEHADVDAFVVEASSFRLERVVLFRPRVAAWLNLAPDHLDWHGDLASYAAAKARIWRAQGPDDIAVVPVDDPIVLEHVAHAASSVVTFSGEPTSTAHVDCGPVGDSIHAMGSHLIDLADMRRRRPHDLANGCAAAAIALSMGADRASVAAELADFNGLPHRLQFAGEVSVVASGSRVTVRCFNDSKATAPHATAAAVRGFEHAVLIAGGRNKGLDLSGLDEVVSHLDAVVAIGEAADTIAEVFTGHVEVLRASTMPEAVHTAVVAAAAHAVHGDRPTADVLLSPACASFDWYPNYAARGDAFMSIVSDLAAHDVAAPGGP